LVSSCGRLSGIERPNPLLNAHAFQRILKLGTAVATHPIGSPVNRENAAQTGVVATKDKIKDSYQFLHKTSSSLGLSKSLFLSGAKESCI
jgi:hypothetical protein